MRSMVSSRGACSACYVNNFTLGIERQDNAKRIMLIGSMLLWTLESLEIANLRHEEADRFCRNESSQLPNLGLILSYFLRFAEDQKKTYRLNEDDWKYSVVQKADKFGVEIRGLNGSEELVERLELMHPKTESHLGSLISQRRISTNVTKARRCGA